MLENGVDEEERRDSLLEKVKLFAEIMQPFGRKVLSLIKYWISFFRKLCMME